MLLLSACGAGKEENPESNAAVTHSPEEPHKVKIQLLWVPQAQFAGIFAAKDKGFYEEEGIDIEIIPGGPDIVAEQQVANGVADVGITAVDSLLVNRDKGIPLVSIAQISQKNSKYLIAKKSTGIDSPEKMKGKKISAFMGGKQFPVVAFLEKNGINPEKDVHLVKQGFMMDQFFNDQVDVSTVTSYNEFNVVKANGITESDLYTFSIEEAGIGMLEDTLIARKEWIENNRDLAVKVVRATLKGWNYAIEHQDEAVEIMMANVVEGSTTKEHQATMLKEMAKLVKPEGFTESQTGMFVEDSYKRTAEIALKYGLIEKPADVKSAYDESIYEEAVKQ
ncbi:ABC transporter substrate-binding protein [Paenibacillus sp. EPM92]|uniref:ABC transporter substrate-binding protein n=1 Tax=Paenibacillus sp. EPM92 TaxID=1561195 RepID=UPI001F2F65EA|nr:ABC transporter substrate-binding protein [Paenibacillus sp. EPM92]